MAYETSNPPRVISRGGIAGPSLWYYSDADADGTVVGADYFSDGDALGMKKGDILFAYDVDASMTVFWVSQVTAGGAAQLTVVLVTT